MISSRPRRRPGRLTIGHLMLLVAAAAGMLAVPWDARPLLTMMAAMILGVAVLSAVSVALTMATLSVLGWLCRAEAHPAPPSPRQIRER